MRLKILRICSISYKHLNCFDGLRIIIFRELTAGLKQSHCPTEVSAYVSRSVDKIC